MAGMDVFNSDGFSVVSLTEALYKEDFLPTRLGSMGLFEVDSIETTRAYVEQVDGVLGLVQSSERGAPPERFAKEKRDMIDFDVPHLSAGDRITAAEVANVRAFGSESELERVENLVNRREMKLRKNLELTLEYHRLGAIQGVVLDADATTLYSLFTAFNVSQETEVDFDLDNGSPASGALRKVCAGIIRTIRRNLKGWNGPLRIGAICGDTFFDQLIAHSETREAVKYWNQAIELRGDPLLPMSFGGIQFENYQGTDDNSTVAVAATKCHIFPIGVPGLFKEIYAPADYMETVNTPGLPFYAKSAPDPQWNKYVDLECQSNPLFLCTQPTVLIKAKNT